MPICLFHRQLKRKANENASGSQERGNLTQTLSALFSRLFGFNAFRTYSLAIFNTIFCAFNAFPFTVGVGAGYATLGAVVDA